MIFKPSFLSPFIIAEIGVNHDCNLNLAKNMIASAARAGANAAKFQFYKADKIASKHSPAYWDLSEEPTHSQYELFSRFDKFDIDDYLELSAYCNECGIQFMATPFDLQSARLIDPLVEVHKIASADITNIPLLHLIASFRKPVIISCGASSLSEIHHARTELISHGATDVYLLHCILNYPTDQENAGLRMISILLKEFGPNVGYSDHTKPTITHDIQISSVLLGAVVLEKHFTYNKKLSGNDHYHSYDELDLATFVSRLNCIRQSYGNETSSSEAFVSSLLASQQTAITNARRSLFYASNLPQGHVLTIEDLVSKRPGFGIPPTKLDELLGLRLKSSVSIDQLVSFSDF